MKKLFITFYSLCIYVPVALAHNKKPTHAHPHEDGGNGNGNGNVPEIDGDEMVLFVSVLVMIYLMFFYSRKNLAKSI